MARTWIWLRYPLLCLAFVGMACNSPTGFSEQDKKGSCAGSEDCSANQKCVNTVCVVSSRPKAPLPWDALPLCKHGDTRPCYDGPKGTAGKGICKAGIQQCKDGKWQEACIGPVKPKAEVCDGKDDNCDGKTDNVAKLGSPCLKQGALGPCAQGRLVCDGSQVVCKTEVQPTKEICNNGKDDDCNGQIDDGCQCTPGAQQQCYTGSEGCRNEAGPDQAPQFLCQGSCKAGVQICDQNSKWGDCRGAQLPQKEECNGLDDNCDGQTDEGFEYQNDQGVVHALGRECKVGVGGCESTGKVVCRDLKAVCDATPKKPSPEICDGIDNDCDGHVDNRPTTTSNDTLTQYCYPSSTGCKKNADGSYTCEGTCKAGFSTCTQGGWGPCTQAVLPATKDLCDGKGKDENCDGTPDDGCQCTNGKTQICGQTDTGACEKGKQTCADGKWGPCVGEVKSKAETCDNTDEDCDGKVDNGLARPCFTGTRGCPSPQTGSNLQACHGICQRGKQICSAGVWLKCVGEVLPSVEICNGKDDDCDGKTDEGFTIRIDNRTLEVGDTCQGGVGACRSKGTVQCASATKAYCKRPFIQVPQPAREPCNGIDDDCDGKTDELCGPKLAYVSNVNSKVKTRDLSIRQDLHSGTKIYRIKSSTAAGSPPIKCSTHFPLLATVRNEKPSGVSYVCDKDDFIVYTFAQPSGSKDLQPSLLPFNAVIPTDTSGKHGKFGVVLCNTSGSSNSCTLHSPFSRLSVNTYGNGIFKINGASECNNRNFHAPLMATRIGEKPGYVRVYPSGYGPCEFQTFDEKGKTALRSFAFWIPPRESVAWAAVNSNGVKVDEGQNYTSRHNNRWTTRAAYQSVRFVGYEASFASWASPSLVLLAPRFEWGTAATTLVKTLSFELSSNINTDIRIFPYTKLDNFAHSIAKITDGFFVLYVDQ